MKSTRRNFTIDGLPVQLWEGMTQAGALCHVFVARVEYPTAELPDEAFADEGPREAARGVIDIKAREV